MKKLTKKQFIKKARKIHGWRYDYSKVVYINSRTKVIIICPIHGEFEQVPASHLSGIGCPDCGYLYLSNLHKSTLEEFIIKANKIHNDKFDYSKFIYINNWTKGIIICHKHGEFLQTPSDHLSGYGCPICKSSKGEKSLIKIFQKHNIKFKHQFNFNEYKRLKYDFYLSELNIIIEFHGGQHFKPIEWFGGLEYFKLYTKRDAFKKSLARDYNIPVIYFTYKHFRLPKEEFEKFVLMIINKVLQNRVIL